MKKISVALLSAALLAPLVLALGGCQTCKPGKPGPVTHFPLQIALAASLEGKSVTVDLVGVNKPGRERWEAYSMTKYWKDGDPFRANAAKKTFNFTSTSALSTNLPPTDAVWPQWTSQAAAYVFVLVDLPGAHPDQIGSLDARRQLLSLDLCDWPADTKQLKVLITEGGPQVTPVQGK